MKVLILTRYGRLAASSRMRFFQYLPWLEQDGFECTVQPFINDAQLQARYQKGSYRFFVLLQSFWRRIWTMVQRRRFDIVWIEKEALPWMPAWFELSLLHSVPYVFDFDDAVFHNYDQHSSAWVRKVFSRRIDQLMMGACLVISGNAYLAKKAFDVSIPRVEIVPTVIDLNKYEVKSVFATASKPLCIVWIGSPTTVRYLTLLRNPLEEISKRFECKLRVIGGGSIDLPSVNVEFVHWTEESEAASIRACDVGIMPLLDGPWEQGKCGYKLIQYMACGLPVVASPVGVNSEIVRAGKNGYLANTDSEWVDALTKLLMDASLRERMGKIGRKYVESQYCIQQVAPRLAALLRTCNAPH